MLIKIATPLILILVFLGLFNAFIQALPQAVTTNNMHYNSQSIKKKFTFRDITHNKKSRKNIIIEAEWKEPKSPLPEGLNFPLIIHLHDTNKVIKKGAKNILEMFSNGWTSVTKNPNFETKIVHNDLAYSAEYIKQKSMSLKYPAFNLTPILPANSIWGHYSKTEKQQIIPYINKAVLQLINEYPIDTKRIYIVGCGIGGTGVFSAINLRPNLYAAGISYSGEWDPYSVENLTSTPLLIITGGNNKIFPAHITRQVATAIKVRGGKAIYKEIKSMPHNCSYKGFYSDNVWKWLFSNRR